uniref:Uncharacterized protein n=1 Tax=Cyprinodon variegatus TaxID=28743 RepID=A0A3Q2EIL8_CYPVA
MIHFTRKLHNPGPLYRALSVKIMDPEAQLVFTVLRHHAFKKNNLFKNNSVGIKIYDFWLYCQRHWRHGVLGLFKGLEAKLLQTVLTAALMFLLYEKIASGTFKVMGLSSGISH